VTRRQLTEAFFKMLMIVSFTLVVASLAGILIVIAYRGVAAVSWSMLTQLPQGGYYLGKEGGILNAIVGSFYLSFGATIAAFGLGLPIAFALQRDYLRPRWANLIRLSLDVLWGTPSIVYGAFGFVVMLWLGLRASLLGGIIALTLLMLPIMTRAMEEAIKMVPPDLKESAYALGATRFEVGFGVVRKQALPGILTGVLLAFGRGIGDAASILFTAGYTDYLPRSIFDPVASLPLAIFFQLGTPIPEVQQRAYGAALVLLVIVLLTSLLSRWMSKRMGRNVIK
jgi:phosphate transport system permease protein